MQGFDSSSPAFSIFSAFIAALFCAALRCAVTGAQAQKRIVMCCCVALCLRVLGSVCGCFCSSPEEWQSKVEAGQGGGEGGGQSDGVSKYGWCESGWC